MLRIIHADSKQNFNPGKDNLNKCILTVAPLPGYYTPDTFVEMLNRVADDSLVKGKHEIISYPVYSLQNGYLMVQVGKIRSDGNCELRWEIGFEDYTTKVLGIDRTPQRPVFLMEGFTDLYLYSDIANRTIVGDKTLPLLCIMDAQTDMPYGSHCTETYEQPWFVPLAQTNFQTIHVYLKNEKGEEWPFQFGRLNLRLSFRREHEF